ncbi:MAG: zinc ribbon domain-containing protein, partial [Lachnospira sp.]|nr:zinc ribbon domain-containing protein [Lachnospira sp.]
MKCRNCGAIVNAETMICEYCGSKHEPKKERKKVNSKVGSTLGIAITIIVVAAVFFVILPVALVMWSFGTDDSGQQKQEYLGERLPKAGTDLVGVMGDCTTKGVTTIYYNDESYKDVKILDSEFIKWMEKDAVNPKGKSIMFSTDENGDITNVYIREYDFVVMYRTGNTYVAFREDDKVMTFETDMELEVDSWYTGYHH